MVAQRAFKILYSNLGLVLKGQAERLNGTVQQNADQKEKARGNVWWDDGQEPPTERRSFSPRD